MRLRIKFLRFYVVALMGIGLSMCSTEEGVKPADDGQLSSRGLISGGSGVVSLIGLSTLNELVNMTVSHSAVETGLIPITGLRQGESIVAIDKTKDLYGLSSMSAIYKIDPVTGMARPLGGDFTPALSGELYGFDVSPSDNVIRVMTSDGQNLRISSTDGQVIGQDPAWHITPLSINSIAYVPGISGGKTILFAIDLSSNQVYRQAPGGTGSVILVGPTGFDWRVEGGFDIASNGVGYTVQFGHGTGSSGPGVGSGMDTSADEYRLHSINLKTGRATSLGIVRPMIGLTVK